MTEHGSDPIRRQARKERTRSTWRRDGPWRASSPSTACGGARSETDLPRIEFGNSRAPAREGRPKPQSSTECAERLRRRPRSVPQIARTSRRVRRSPRSRTDACANGRALRSSRTRTATCGSLGGSSLELASTARLVLDPRARPARAVALGRRRISPESSSETEAFHRQVTGPSSSGSRWLVSPPQACATLGVRDGRSHAWPSTACTEPHRCRLGPAPNAASIHRRVLRPPRASTPDERPLCSWARRSGTLHRRSRGSKLQQVARTGSRPRPGLPGSTRGGPRSRVWKALELLRGDRVVADARSRTRIPGCPLVAGDVALTGGWRRCIEAGARRGRSRAPNRLTCPSSVTVALGQGRGAGPSDCDAASRTYAGRPCAPGIQSS